MNTQLFPRLFAASILRDDPFWQQSFDSTSSESCFSVVYHCESEFEQQQGYDNLIRLSSAVIEDIMQLKEQAADKVIYDFLQFSIGTIVSLFITNNKVTGLAYNWLANSIDDVISEEPIRNPDPGRIYFFLLSNHPFIRERRIEFISEWCHALYYYSRISGGHYPIADAFLDSYGRYYLSIAPDNFSTVYIVSLCDILGWSITNNRADRFRQVSSRLLWIYQSPACPPGWKKIVVFQFSCVTGGIGGHSQEFWANVILTTYRDQLRGFEELQSLVNYTIGDCERIVEHWDDFNNAIDRYRESLRLPEGQSSYMSYELARSFEVLMPILLTLIKSNNSNRASSLFIHFFDIRPPLGDTDYILHIMPNDINGVVYNVSQQSVVIGDENKLQSYINVVRKLNAFLQHSIYLTGYQEYEPPPPPGDRNGTPLEARAEEYFNALRMHFNFDRARETLPLLEATSYYLYNGFNLPLQPVMLKEIDMVVPMCFSYQELQEARAIRSVLVWQDDSMFSSRECEGIIHILAKANIRTVLLDAAVNTIDDLRQAYESNDFDCIHISAHGEHRHYDPHTSYLHLSNTIQLHDEQLAAFQNNWEGRRLLLLNVCDGATTSLYNSPASMGISSHLIHKKQSVLSHMWPVNPTVAVVYGSLFATCIVRGLPYKDIYKEVASILSQGKEAIIEYLREFVDDDEMLQNIEHTNIDFMNFTHWGSLAYFE